MRRRLGLTLTVAALQRVLPEPLAAAALVVGPQRRGHRLQLLRLAQALPLQPGGGGAAAEAAVDGPGLLHAVLVVAQSCGYIDSQLWLQRHLEADVEFPLLTDCHERVGELVLLFG